MLDFFHSTHWYDHEGRPAGGISEGIGFTIAWQNGPLGRADGPGGRRQPNGAFVETIIAAAKDRLEYYQSSRFNCEENAEAIRHLALALAILNDRTARREAAGTEGTHEGA